MPVEPPKKQRIHASNLSPNIAEALSARTKDPLWFLSRQWQTGEFEAENGGALAGIELSSRSFPVTGLKLGNKKSVLEPHAPLEAIVEAEANDGDSPAWRSEALEYTFELSTSAHTLKAVDYGGFNLDWYHFDLKKISNTTKGTVTTAQFIPNQLNFRGAPHPRWWKMEDGGAFFDTPDDPEPNILSTILPEFFYTDINNWYIIPAPMTSGSIREIMTLSVTDSFGVTTVLNPVNDKEWKLFSLTADDDSSSTLDGRFLFAPNIAIDILHNDTLEDVRFIRDEQSNLVWAWEHLYKDSTGEYVFNGDGLSVPEEPIRASDPGGIAPLPEFKLMSETLPNWIPYVPKRINPNDAIGGEMYLRRGRTMETATKINPQYKSKIVDESITLNEEEIPRTGLRVRRISRYARGSDGEPYFWVGRHKDAGRGYARSGLRFDYLEENNS